MGGGVAYGKSRLEIGRFNKGESMYTTLLDLQPHSDHHRNDISFEFFINFSGLVSYLHACITRTSVYPLIDSTESAFAFESESCAALVQGNVAMVSSGMNVTGKVARGFYWRNGEERAFCCTDIRWNAGTDMD